MARNESPADVPVTFSRRTMFKAAVGATAAVHFAPGFDELVLAQDANPLDSVALDGSPGQAYASHKARAIGLAQHFARTRSLDSVKDQAGEDNVTTLIAHLHAASVDPGFKAFDKVSLPLIPDALRRLNRGNGEVGTTGVSTDRDYDMGLKGLVILLYRYPHLLGDGGVDFILNDLVPIGYGGGHPSGIEIVEQSFLNIDSPETENHLLMIESSRYLINQILHDRTGDRTFDNKENGLTDWLFGYMQVIAKHDFLEFNSRPYARLAVHPLLNLHEFARDKNLQDAAQMLLDYTMMKFAVSSSRGRRVSPFRRQQHRITHTASEKNFLYASSGEQMSGYFMSYTGYTAPGGEPAGFPLAQDFTGLLGALAAYRPPPAAYIVALKNDTPASFHRFFHGTRPELPASGDQAEPGLELYFRSPSFLMSAGGQFLNSGYGRDEIDVGKNAWEQTSRAQATTLIPTRADVLFHDLLRFDPFPDPMVNPYADDPEDPDCYRTESVNIGVHRGLMAGANLRPADKIVVLENSAEGAVALAAHTNRLLIGWKGSGNDNLNVAKVEDTSLFGIDGVEGIEWKAILGDSSDAGPALASHNGRVFLAWRGSGNNQLNMAFSEDDGVTFKGKAVFGDTSDFSPALASHAGRLYLAWTGEDEALNVAMVALFGNTAGGFGIEGLENHVVLGATSEAAPALAPHNGRLFIGWKGSGNDNLNIAFSNDNGASFSGTATFEESSDAGPALTSHAGRLFMAWRGSGNENLNLAKVTLFGNTAGGFGIEGLEGKVVLGEISEQAPSIASYREQLFLAWKGEGDDNLNIRVSRDGSFGPPESWVIRDLSHFGFYLAVYRTPPAQGVPGLENLGLVYAMEAAKPDGTPVMPFDQFQRIRELNAGLPANLAYGATYEFHTPDDKHFSVWTQVTEDKYRARIIDLNEPNPVRDFATLPLVDGPYLSTPGGHDGLIEIRDPGCADSPIVLDFRNAANPVRTDNKTECPGPWLERIHALLAIAQKFDELGRAGDARTARQDGAQLYDEFVRLDSTANGPVLAPTVIQGLATMGVDFSVPENELREWLSNPEFTPYPAITYALLNLGVRLKDPVYLDVIVGFYEGMPGVPSPRAVEDVRIDVLKESIRLGYNERYGTNLSSFDQVVKS